MTDENTEQSERRLRPRPEHLPARVEDLERTLKSQRTINDYVEDIFIDLYKNDQFRELLEAVWDPDAVEGSLAADNFCAVQMIRDAARKADENHPLAKKKLATLNLSLGVVLRRYEADRKHRRQTVDGKTVPNDGE